MLKLENITLRFKEFELKEVNLEVPKKESILCF